MDITLGILFFTLNNDEINFIDCYIYWRLYTIIEVLLITRSIELIGKKKFIVVALDPENKAFVVYIAFMNLDSNIQPFWRANIVLLKAYETSTIIFSKYADFAMSYSKI